jgi:hypothetical protein
MKYNWPNITLGIIELVLLGTAIVAAFYGDYAKAAAFVGFALYCGTSKS